MSRQPNTKRAAKPLELTDTMRLAIERSKAQWGGKFTRHPGGWWCGDKDSVHESFASSTIEALVRRGLATYTKWKNDHFAIEATLIQKD